MDDIHCTHCQRPINRRVSKRTIRPFCDMRCYGEWQKGRSFSDQSKPMRPKRICSIRGCESTHFGRGYCRKHYLSVIKPPQSKGGDKYNCKRCGVSFLAYRKAKYCSSKCSGLDRKKPFIIKKGYKKLLLPDHPRADAKGYVFEHIVIAEATLGRSLHEKEVVHHLDHNKLNNEPGNLRVCRDNAEHLRLYH